MSDKAFFIGDHAALDFLNTIAAPRGEVIEFIADGDAYLSWLVDADLLGIDDRQALQTKFGRTGLDRVANEARKLREWFRQLIAKPMGAKAMRSLSPQETIATLNEILSLGSTHRALEADAKRLVLREKRGYTNARQLLVPVAEAISELLTADEQSLIKRCANPNCTMWFFDRTKAHRRLFCSAAVCGNRAKVAAFRERQRLAN
jgi:predicted RNA-binding Zn ribbon-like protein